MSLRNESTGRSLPLILPHSATARLLTEVVAHDGNGFIEAIGRVPATHPLVTSHGAPVFLGIEIGAQAAAALQALVRSTGTGSGEPQVGHLVSVREAAFLREHLPVDTPIEVTARLEGSAPPLAIYRIEVRSKEVVWMTAILSTHCVPA